MKFCTFPTAFGQMVVAWDQINGASKVIRIFLPRHGAAIEESVKCNYPEAGSGSDPEIEELAHEIASFMAGEEVEFELDLLSLDVCSEFRRRVLLAEHGIPRGWVSTYGRIAARLGVPGGARAVGNALAKNLFPIVIPCHRVVRSGGKLGGYQGGLEMKRALLKMEGVGFTPSGKVALEKVYY